MSQTIDDKAWDLLVKNVDNIRDGITTVDTKITAVDVKITKSIGKIEKRVHLLENWRSYVTGAVGVLVVMVGLMWRGVL